MNESRGSGHQGAHIDVIASRGNKLVKFLRAVRDGREKDFIFIEGVRLCEEAASRTDLVITEAIYVPDLIKNKRGARLLELLGARRGVRLAATTEEVFAFVSDTKTAQGIALIAERPQTTEPLQLDTGFEESSTIAPLFVVLHGVANPSNAGAILRAAEAAGASGAIATEGTCDLFAPKALRGAMGSSFRLPLWTNAGADTVARWCIKRGVSLYSLDARGARLYTEVDWRLPSAVVVGSESAGFPENSIAGEMLRIQMRPPVESLNVAVALAVVLYEAARQRSFRR